MCYCDPEKEGARTWYQRPERTEQPTPTPEPQREEKAEEEQGIPVDWPVPQKVENCWGVPYEEPSRVEEDEDEEESEDFVDIDIDEFGQAGDWDEDDDFDAEPIEPDPSDAEEVGLPVDWPARVPALVPESSIVYIP